MSGWNGWDGGYFFLAGGLLIHTPPLGDYALTVCVLACMLSFLLSYVWYENGWIWV